MHVATGAERRNHHRAEIFGRALVLTDDDHALSYQLENLSAGGALLTGGPALRLRSRIRLVLRGAMLPDASIEAEVAWEPEGDQIGWGVRFMSLDASMEDLIQDWVLLCLNNDGSLPSPPPRSRFGSWLP